MDSAITSAELLHLLRAGDQQAAQTLFERYAERLRQLAYRRLSARLAARTDPDDIVMSAYRSVFVGAREGRFQVERGGDLWRLLVEVTLHKLYRQVAHHTARRRNVRLEVAAADSHDPLEAAAGREPTPEAGLIAAEELEHLLGKLCGRGRTIVELRLQGHTQEEIADRLGCTTRTVRKWLQEARKVLAGQGESSSVKKSPRAASESLPRTGTRRLPKSLNEQMLPEARLDWSDFVLRQQIGAGSTGKVYRAQRQSDGQEFAVKFLRKSLARDAAVVARFLREAKTVSELKHEGIVSMHGAGTTPGGGYFLVMDLVQGFDLQRVRLSRAVESQTAAQWIAEAARTLHFAHESGIIHCDLKPGNLLLNAQGRILVTDFGLAKRLADGSHGILAGTPAFMSPEQVDPWWGAIGPSTDVWGLGAVLYFLLFGRPPHVGNTTADVLARVVSGQSVEFPSQTDRHAASLIAIVQRCLTKPQSQRFQTARELAKALGR